MGEETMRATGDAGTARHARRVRWIALASLVGVAVCTITMISAWGIEVARAPGNKSRVDRLVEQVKTDPEIAPVLLAEREGQTAVSLVHKRLNRVLAWTLLVAGSVFIAASKRYYSLRPQPLPDLDALVATRFPVAPEPNGKTARRTTSPFGNGEDTLDLSFVDDLVASSGRSREAAIPILQAIQTHYRYLPEEALRRVCELTEITPAQIAGTSSFYAQFRRSPVGRHVVRVCHGTACHVAGAEQITRELRRHLDVPPNADTDPQRLFTLDAVACVGCCSLAPVMMIEDETAGRLTPATARQTLDALEPRS